jgi:hypothetical protein
MATRKPAKKAAKKAAKRKPDPRNKQIRADIKKARADRDQLVKTAKKLELDLQKVVVHLNAMAILRYKLYK